MTNIEIDNKVNEIAKKALDCYMIRDLKGAEKSFLKFSRKHRILVAVAIVKEYKNNYVMFNVKNWLNPHLIAFFKELIYA